MHSDGTKDAPSPDAGTPASPAVGRARPDLRTLHLWQLQPVRDVLVIAAIAGTVYAGYAIRTVTIPLLVALLLAYLCEPVVARLTRSGRMGRPMAVSVIFGALTVLLGASEAVGVGSSGHATPRRTCWEGEVKPSVTNRYPVAFMATPAG